MYKRQAFGFPYRNIVDEWRGFKLSKHFTHAQHVRHVRFLSLSLSPCLPLFLTPPPQTADIVLKEVGLAPESYVGIHWRESEEGCQLERESAHAGFDMCFGTSAFYWAKSDDVIYGVLQEINKTGATGVYLATDTFEDHVVAKFRKAFPNFRRSYDSPTLSATSLSRVKASERFRQA